MIKSLKKYSKYQEKHFLAFNFKPILVSLFTNIVEHLHSHFPKHADEGSIGWSRGQQDYRKL